MNARRYRRSKTYQLVRRVEAPADGAFFVATPAGSKLFTARMALWQTDPASYPKPVDERDVLFRVPDAYGCRPVGVTERLFVCNADIKLDAQHLTAAERADTRHTAAV